MLANDQEYGGGRGPYATGIFAGFSQDWYLPRRFGFFDLAASIDCEHRFDASTPEDAKGSALRRLGSAGHVDKIDKNTLKLCQSYHWPGNIRELQNIVERSVILCTGDTFRMEKAWLSSPDAPRMDSAGPLTENLRSYEKELIEAALAESKGKVAGPYGAAAKLGVPPSTLHLKIKQLNIKKNTVR